LTQDATFPGCVGNSSLAPAGLNLIQIINAPSKQNTGQRFLCWGHLNPVVTEPPTFTFGFAAAFCFLGAMAPIQDLLGSDTSGL